MYIYIASIYNIYIYSDNIMETIQLAVSQWVKFQKLSFPNSINPSLIFGNISLKCQDNTGDTLSKIAAFDMIASLSIFKWGSYISFTLFYKRLRQYTY